MTSVNIPLPKFDKNDDWQLYSEQLDNYFIVSESSDDKKVSILLTLLSPQVYKTLRELCEPIVPKDKSFDELDSLMKVHFSKAAKKVFINVFEERRKFFRAVQGEKENVSQWFDRLKKMSTTCSFGANLQNNLRDKFVTGLRNEYIFKQLCKQESTIDMNKALQCAVDAESSRYTNAPTKKTFAPINKDQKNDLKQTGQDNFNEKIGRSNLVCIYCGETKHDFKLCKNKQYNCSQCGRDGHLAKACHFHSKKSLATKLKSVPIPDFENTTKVYSGAVLAPGGPSQIVNDFNDLSTPKKSGKNGGYKPRNTKPTSEPDQCVIN